MFLSTLSFDAIDRVSMALLLPNQNGQVVRGNKKLFLVLRSNVPNGFAQFPTVAAVVKIDYKDQ